MKVSYSEGPANHAGPESCAALREEGGEALTGGMQARTSSREIYYLRGADAVGTRGRQHAARRHGEARSDPARSVTLRMHASDLHGNREIPATDRADGGEVRAVNPKGARRR